MWQNVHPELQPNGSQETAHWRKTLSMQEVWQEVRQQLSRYLLHGATKQKRQKVISVHGVRQEVLHGVRPEGAHGGPRVVEATHERETARTGITG